MALVPEDFAARKDAVIFREACKAYGKGQHTLQVLDDFDMTVKRGIIYALLGASGCGKTTVLSCIVGHLKLDSGDVRIFRRKPNTKECGVPGPLVGYMPQNKGLNPKLTIGEIINYFGQIHGMTQEYISMRQSFLLKLLQLPDKSRTIYTLSGGQQKRLSFVIALLHEPKLFILDEPTVGVDPLLRRLIWKHLRELTLDGNTTIIMTTHYIEEARQADMVGLMRSGHLLAQEKPEDLIRQHKAKNMEEVFLSLCITDESINIRRESGISIDPTEMAEINAGALTKKQYHLEDHMEQPMSVLHRAPSKALFKTPSPVDHVVAIIKKNFVWAYRDYKASVTMLHISAFIMLLVCFVLGNNARDIKLAVVNGEWPQDPICQPIDECLFLNLSCRFMRGIDPHTVTLVPYENEEEALAAVEKGHAYGMLSFPSNYSDSISERVLEGINVDNYTLLTSVVNLRMDMSNQQIGLMIQRVLLLRFEEFAKEVLALCGINPNAVSMVEFGEPVYGVKAPSFVDFIIPGILINAVFAVLMTSSGAIIIMEKEDGMLERIVIAGVTHLEFMVSQIVTQSLIIVYIVTGTLLVVYLYLGVLPNSSLPLLFLLCFLQGLCATCVGFFVGVAVHTFLAALFIGIWIIMYNNVLCTMLWPVEGALNVFARWLVYTNPLTWAVEASRSMLNRGMTYNDNWIWPGFVSSVGWITILFLLTLVALRGFRASLVRV